MFVLLWGSCYSLWPGIKILREDDSAFKPRAAAVTCGFSSHPIQRAKKWLT